MNAGETREILAATARNTLDKAAAGVSGLLDWLTPAKPKPPPLPYQGPTPEGVAFLVMRVAGSMRLNDRTLDRAATRLREGGYNDAARNYGSVRCLLAHAHGTDARCVVCQDAEGKKHSLRCFGSDEQALRQLLVVSRARALGGAIAPVCTQCQSRDAEPGLTEDEPWTLCSLCRSLRAREAAARAETDPALMAVRSARDKLGAQYARKPWFRGIGLGDDGKGNATIDLRVSKLTPRLRRDLPAKVCDENAAWIKVNVRPVGETMTLGTDVGGYRSMEVHAKAPPAREADGANPLDDLGRADELAAWVGQPGAVAETPDIDHDRTPTEFIEDKAHELAAAWAGLAERMRVSPTLARVLGPLRRSWEDFWARYHEGSTSSPEELAGVIDDTNAALAGAIADVAQEQIAALKARAQTHNEAVQEALQTPMRDEPEFQEYAKRWAAWVEKLKSTIERHESKLQWVKELAPFQEDRRLTEVHVLQDEFNAFLGEWDRVKLRIGVRKGEAQVKKLEEGAAALKKVKSGEATEAEKSAAAAALEEKRRIDEARAKGQSTTLPDLPKSPATPAPSAPPPAPGQDPLSYLKGALTPGKLLLLGGVAAAAVLATLRSLVR